MVAGLVAIVAFGAVLTSRLPDARARDDVAKHLAIVQHQLTDRRVQVSTLEDNLRTASRQLSEEHAATEEIKAAIRDRAKEIRELRKKVGRLRDQLASLIVS